MYLIEYCNYLSGKRSLGGGERGEGLMEGGKKGGREIKRERCRKRVRKGWRKKERKGKNTREREEGRMKVVEVEGHEEGMRGRDKEKGG